MPKLLVFKYGKPGQPFGKEATDFATEKLSGKDVRIKLYATDQYNRAVASVQYKDYIFKPLGLGYWKDISEEILKNGGGGAAAATSTPRSAAGGGNQNNFSTTKNSYFLAKMSDHMLSQLYNFPIVNIQVLLF